MQPQDVLDFWFVEHGPSDWYSGDPAFDERCKERLSAVHAKAVRSELWAWRKTVEGRVAELVLLDQVSRQLFRGDARAFAADTMALALAQEAVAQGLDKDLDLHHRLFVYMPYEHAESAIIQEESVRLFESLGSDDYLSYALEHRDTIARFGRFPFRNAALGRQSTPEEIAYMQERDGKAY
ncbi:MAG TPA: DUF924 family protein [Pelagibacterium sp.]|uniref:DUF924 family protein n=1 Tax=Pelagibacterium sp. TaxID=1967288 RepID=UPI002C8A91E6|nr:DUF924 family protein [Pelagibacterium sp.]HWJ88959.1 DUF924 family protein [Pelagibacterium sp.]